MKKKKLGILGLALCVVVVCEAQTKQARSSRRPKK